MKSLQLIALAASLCMPLMSRAEGEKPLNVLFIVIDDLRAPNSDATV